MISRPIVVIILHYGRIEDTVACLRSLEDDMSNGIKVLVVDNGTRAEIADLLATQFPKIATLTLADNLGWAGGNNVGIAWALEHGAEQVTLLNNDTTVPAGSIEALAEAATAYGDCLLHPAIDFANPVEGVQIDPSRSQAARPLRNHIDLYPLPFAYGACLMIPRSVFERIGVFDEQFFLQLEETDFYMRARAAGIPSLCLTSVRITHHESRSFGCRMPPQKLYYIARNQLLLAEKHTKTLTGYAQAFRSLYWRAANQSPHPLLWLLSRDSGAKAMRQGISDYLRRRFGKSEVFS